MSATSSSTTKLLVSRNELMERIGPLSKGVPVSKWNMLLAKLPDVDLAATAVMMDPRPQWVTDIIGDPPKLVKDRPPKPAKDRPES